MSTSNIDNRASAYSTLDNDSPNALENGMGSSNSSTPITINENNESTWTNSFAQLDRILSGSLLQLCYRIIDIIILFIGLSSEQGICTLSNHLAVTSISLLAFYFIDIAIIVYCFFRNISSHYKQLTEEEKVEHFRHVTALRSFFTFFKLIPVCIGTAYALSSSAPYDCELMRFCLGLVCISTLLTLIIPPTKPEIPPRRSFILECFILSFLLIINATYIGTVASSMINVEEPTCTYKEPEDIYLGAPLKSYAYVGLILFGCTTVLHIINLCVSQLCNRITHGRRFYSYYYALQYALNYFSALIVIYYFSIGALFLFKPRAGQPCKAGAPGLYRTLLIWQWIRILFPLLAVPLILVLCCLGVFFGIIISYCLPASITVPLLELVRVS
jgi:hypothetical protein